MSWTPHILAVYICLAVCLSGAVNSKSISEDQSETEGCPFEGVTYKIGDEWPAPVGQCALYTCKENGLFTGVTCPGLAATPESGCIIDIGNKTVQYPNCCPRAVCPETSPAKP